MPQERLPRGAIFLFFRICKERASRERKKKNKGGQVVPRQSRSGVHPRLNRSKGRTKRRSLPGLSRILERQRERERKREMKLTRAGYNFFFFATYNGRDVPPLSGGVSQNDSGAPKERGIGEPHGWSILARAPCAKIFQTPRQREPVSTMVSQWGCFHCFFSPHTHIRGRWGTRNNTTNGRMAAHLNPPQSEDSCWPCTRPDVWAWPTLNARDAGWW